VGVRGAVSAVGSPCVERPVRSPRRPGPLNDYLGCRTSRESESGRAGHEGKASPIRTKPFLV
jgi:hypothetical protein